MLGAVSVTLAAAAIASQSVDAYGAVIAPALPVSSLTRNIAWALMAVLGFLVILNGLGLSWLVAEDWLQQFAGLLLPRLRLIGRQRRRAAEQGGRVENGRLGIRWIFRVQRSGGS